MSDSYATGSIDGWSFNLGGPADDGVELVLSGLDGWESSDVDVSITKLAGYDGGLFGQPTLKPRVLTISGGVEAPTGPELERALDRLAVAFAHDRDVRFALDEPLPRSITGRRTSKVQVVREGATGARWQVELSCPDPRRYGPERRVSIPMESPPAGIQPNGVFPIAFDSAGEQALVNDGNAKLPLRFTIVGPASQPVVQIGDRSAGWDIDLLAGQTLEVDVLAGTVLLDGVANRRSRQYVDSQALVLEPGTSVAVFRGASYNPDAVLLVHLADAYL